MPMFKKSLLAAAVLAGSVSVASAQDTAKMDEVVQSLHDQAPTANIMTVTSDQAGKSDQTVSLNLAQLSSWATCDSHMQGIQRLTLVFANAADLAAQHADLNNVFSETADAYKPYETKINLTPSPTNKKPNGMGIDEWQERYYLTQIANDFKKAHDINLTFVVVEVPNPNMHCNVQLNAVPQMKQ